MTYSNDELVRKFRRGDSSGKACNMEIKGLEINGENRGTILVDYKWAILAHRSPRGRKITLFDGWYGWSKTTSAHVNKARRVANRVIDEKVRLDNSFFTYYKDIPVPEEWDEFPYASQLEGKIERALNR